MDGVTANATGNTKINPVGEHAQFPVIPQSLFLGWHNYNFAKNFCNFAPVLL